MKVRAKIIIDIETIFEDEESTEETLMFCLSEDIQNQGVYTLHDIRLVDDTESEEMNRLTKRNEHGGIVSAMEKTHPDVERVRFMHKLAQYEELEEQGRLVILPCRVGTKGYYFKRCERMCDSLMEGKVENCDGCPFHEYKLMCVTITLEDMNNVGKTIFLTREEAEQALKKSGSLPCGRKSQCNEPEDSELCTQCRKSEDAESE